MRVYAVTSIIFLFTFLSEGWGKEINLITSNLPIVVIDTDNITIPDEPRINARMGIIWNHDNVNNINDPFNEFEGNIVIEIRGSSSQMFEKKSYGLELRDSLWADMDASLLGMPGEEDWILYGPYMDKSLLRNVITFTLDASLGHYSPRCRFVELVINNDYKGLYVLMEKIKRGKDRIDIARLRREDIQGEELTGGYIIKIDKTTGSGGAGFSSEFSNRAFSQTFYQYEYPKPEELQPEQMEYIREYVSVFEQRIYNQEFDPETGYGKYIDILSFVDYQIMNELARNVDAYRLSTFYFKDKNGKLHIGPLWDFNLGYGNANYYGAWSEYGFEFNADLGNDGWQNPFYWEEFRKDPNYCVLINQRWKELRENKLSDERVFFVIDSLTNLISQASARNFSRWKYMGQYVWPNYYVGPSWEAEAGWLKTWISNRLDWLDYNFPMWFSGEKFENGFIEGDLMIPVPNPFHDELVFYIKSGFNYRAVLHIYSGSGVLVCSEEIDLNTGMNHYEFRNAMRLSRGMYIYQLLKGDEVLTTGKMVKSHD